MKKKVPEEKVPSREEQLKSLREKLVGNKTFGACRGKLSDPFFGTIENSESSSHFCSVWDNLAPKMRIMGNLLAQYKRDGWLDAYSTLQIALRSESYLIPGETIPLEQTAPFTVIMFEPDKTLTLIRWLLGVHWCELDEYLDKKDGKVGNWEFHSSGLTQQLFQELPSLEKHARERRRKCRYEGEDLEKAYDEDVALLAPEDGKVIEQMLSDLGGKRLYLGRTKMGDPQWNDHIENIDIIPVAYIFPVEAKKVLKYFSRKKQREIGIWSFNYPKVEIDSEFNLNIGLHAEEEQSRWRKESPMGVSLNSSCGLGAVIFSSSIASAYELNSHGNYCGGKDDAVSPRFSLSTRYQVC